MTCRHCGPRYAALPRSRHRATRPTPISPPRAARARDVVSAAVARLHGVLAGADRGPRRPGDVLLRRLRVLQLFLSSWVASRQQYVEHAIARFGLGGNHRSSRSPPTTAICCSMSRRAASAAYGIEPTASTAAAARRGHRDRRGILRRRARRAGGGEGRAADLIAANNVLAHVPDINDFVAGFARLLKPRRRRDVRVSAPAADGADTQFDTAYHEHYSYLSLTAVHAIFEAATDSGCSTSRSCRHTAAACACSRSAADERRRNRVGERVGQLLARRGARPASARLVSTRLPGGGRAGKTSFLCSSIESKARAPVAAYGAAAKGNTLLTSPASSPICCRLSSTRPGQAGQIPAGQPHSDRSPPSALTEYRPDDVLILPWNIAAEVVEQQAALRQGGTRFITAVPKLRRHGSAAAVLMTGSTGFVGWQIVAALVERGASRQLVLREGQRSTARSRPSRRGG